MKADKKKRSLIHCPDLPEAAFGKDLVRHLSDTFACRAGTLHDALCAPAEADPPVLFLYQAQAMLAPDATLAADDLCERLKRFVREGGVLLWSFPAASADAPTPLTGFNADVSRDLADLALAIHVEDEAQKARLLTETRVSPHKVLVQSTADAKALAGALAQHVATALDARPIGLRFEDGPRQALLSGRPFPPAAPARTAIVTLNYGPGDDALRLTTSLEASDNQDFDIYLVDNASPETSRHELATRFPRAHLLCLPENLGYAAGNNAALQLIDDLPYAFIWILNPDIEVPPDALGKFIAAAEAHPEWSIFGPVISRSTNPTRVASAGCSISKKDGLSITQIDAGKYAANLPPVPYPADFITGAAIFLRNTALKDIGYLPEGYFLYFEETQWLLEAAEKGHPSIVLPTIKLIHHQHSHAGGLPAPYYIYYFIRSAMLFASTMQGYDADAVLKNLRGGFLEHWLSRIRDRAPDKLPMYEHLADQAIADGKAGKTGPVDLEAIEHVKTAKQT